MSENSDDGATQRLIRPPKLQTGRSGGASRLELFFDLAYVLVAIQLADSLVEDLTWHGLGVFVGLFTAVWVSWVGFTLYANRFDTDDVVFRVAKLTATLSIAGCAASASEATGDLGTAFAASFALGRVILFLLYVRAWWHVPSARPTVNVYLLTVGVSAVLWAASVPISGTSRYVLWAAGSLIAAAGPVIATVRPDKLPLHAEHLPERFALLVILVLGEAVGGASTGVHDAEWASIAVVAGIAGFAIAAALWWIYFDLTADESASRLAEADREEEQAVESEPEEDERPDGPPSDRRHDLFIYGHLPIALGVVMAGAGAEDLVVHAGSDAGPGAAWVLDGGLSLFLIGSAMVRGGALRSWRAVWPWPLGMLPFVVVCAAVPQLTGIALMMAYALLTIGFAVIGTTRQRHLAESAARSE